MSEQLQLRRGTVSQVAGFTRRGRRGCCRHDQQPARPQRRRDTRRRAARKTRRGDHQHAHGRLWDVAYTALFTDRLVAYTTLTAARASSRCRPPAPIRTGTQLLIIDESGSCSVTKICLTVNAAGTDHIDGSRFSGREREAYGYIEIESNGVGAWTNFRTGFYAPGDGQPGRGAAWRSIQMQVLEQTVNLLGRFHQRFDADPRQTASSWRSARACVLTTITGPTSYEIGVSGNLSQFGSLLSLPAPGHQIFGLMRSGPPFTRTRRSSSPRSGACSRRARSACRFLSFSQILPAA